MRKGNLILSQYATPTHTKHNLLLLGDCHIEAQQAGLVRPDNSFSVTGITTPNSDIKGITSPSHFAPDNLTKQEAYSMEEPETLKKKRI